MEKKFKKVALEVTQLTIGQFVLVNKYQLGNEDKRVKYLRKVERAFKKAYKIDTPVLYIDERDKALIAKKNKRGYRHNLKNEIVVFLTNDIDSNCKTLLHELTHAYQHKHMNTKFKASKKEYVNEEVTYRNAWHERHARRCADVLITNMDFTINLSTVKPYKVKIA